MYFQLGMTVEHVLINKVGAINRKQVFYLERAN